MARVDDREGWRRLVASLAEWTRGMDGTSESARTIERDGLVASVIPAASERSVVNSVVYEDAGELAAAYDELHAAYDNAWAVWVPDHDDEAAALLAERGHVLDSDPEAMVLDLDEILRPPEPPAFDRSADPAGIGVLNDQAYGTAGSFERALGGLAPRDGLYAYVGEAEGG